MAGGYKTGPSGPVLKGELAILKKQQAEAEASAALKATNAAAAAAERSMYGAFNGCRRLSSPDTHLMRVDLGVCDTTAGDNATRYMQPPPPQQPRLNTQSMELPKLSLWHSPPPPPPPRFRSLELQEIMGNHEKLLALTPEDKQLSPRQPSYSDRPPSYSDWIQRKPQSDKQVVISCPVYSQQDRVTDACSHDKQAGPGGQRAVLTEMQQQQQQTERRQSSFSGDSSRDEPSDVLSNQSWMRIGSDSRLLLNASSTTSASRTSEYEISPEDELCIFGSTNASSMLVLGNGGSRRRTSCGSADFQRTSG
jgi:hypothetical protein